MTMVLIEVITEEGSDLCGEYCRYGMDETCSLVPMADGRGITRECDPGSYNGSRYYRTRACLAAEAKAKGGGK